MVSSILGLEGKVALVTGAGRNIGKGCATMLAKAGCRVCVVDVDPQTGQQTAKEIAALGQKVRFIKADVKELDQIHAMIDSCVKELGGMDVCVNNVGGFAGYTHMSYLDTTPQHFQDIVGLNFWPTYFCQQAEAKSMVQRKVKGSIINIASNGALAMRWGDACYTACKAAVIKLTMDAAFELGPLGIRVNCICPGFVPGPALEPKLKDGSLQPIADVLPLRKIATKEDLGGVAVFLASDLSSHVTGHAIPVDGGDSATSIRSGIRGVPWSAQPTRPANT